MGKHNIALLAVGFTVLVSAFTAAQNPDTEPAPEKLSSQVAALSKKALAGDTKAQLRMGLAFEFGTGVGKDLDQAMRWYRMAADRGDPVAQTDLAYLYETGANGPRDPAESAKWYMRAAISGLARAKFNLGVLYLEGRGVQRSDEEAAHWIAEAADDGCPSAIVALSYLYADGKGVSRDPQKALQLRQEAAKQKENDPNQCMRLNPRASRGAIVRAGFAAGMPAP